jgi:hypothetical protein
VGIDGDCGTIQARNDAGVAEVKKVWKDMKNRKP